MLPSLLISSFALLLTVLGCGVAAPQEYEPEPLPASPVPTQAPQPLTQKPSSLPTQLEITVPFELGQSAFYEGPHTISGNRIRIQSPEQSIVAIYSHGSLAENIPDQCQPGDPSATPVGLLKALNGMRINQRLVTVMVFCSSAKVGGFNSLTGQGEPKVQKRARELTTLLRSFIGVGFPARQIVLLGHSAGAWASLTAAAQARESYAALVALNPAFAGPLDERDQGWWALRQTLGADLAKSSGIKALVYVIEEDEFERPQDLAFIGNISSVRLTQLSAKRQLGCNLREYHLTAFNPCFQGQYAAIQSYVAQEVQAAP